jgi:hypothetical protein
VPDGVDAMKFAKWHPVIDEWHDVLNEKGKLMAKGKAIKRAIDAKQKRVMVKQRKRELKRGRGKK